MKLDLGCGSRKQPGFEGVDHHPFEGVDHVLDLRQRWPWDDSSVDEVHSSHFVEHLTNPERVHFWNELYRVLKPGKFENGQPVGGTARIIVPNWSHASAYGDPTHQWPPFSEWAVLYLDKQWRAGNAPHTDLTCDFLYITGGSWDEWLATRHEKTFAMQRYTNSCRELFFTLVKRD